MVTSLKKWLARSEVQRISISIENADIKQHSSALRPTISSVGSCNIGSDTIYERALRAHKSQLRSLGSLCLAVTRPLFLQLRAWKNKILRLFKGKILKLTINDQPSNQGLFIMMFQNFGQDFSNKTMWILILKNYVPRQRTNQTYFWFRSLNAYWQILVV